MSEKKTKKTKSEGKRDVKKLSLKASPQDQLSPTVSSGKEKAVKKGSSEFPSQSPSRSSSRAEIGQQREESPHVSLQRSSADQQTKPIQSNLASSEKTNLDNIGDKFQGKPSLPNGWTTKGHPSYKHWAQVSSIGKTWVRCRYCAEDVLVESCYGRNSHQTTTKHDNKEREWFELHADSDDMEFRNEESSKNQNEGRRKDPKNTMFEYELIQFLASQNCPLSFGDDLIAFLKNKVKDSATIKDASCYRKKTSLLLNDCYKPLIKENLESILAKNLFSLIVDASTDRTRTKYLALVVQYWDQVKGPQCRPFSLIDCSRASTSEQIYNMIDDQLIQKPYGKNLVCFASDGESVLRGKRNSVLTRLRQKFDSLFDLHCIPHSFNLISSFAAQGFPDYVEYLVKTIYNHFSYSSKRSAEWSDLQASMELKPYKIVQWSEIRWSSLFEAINRILIRWDSLLIYFKLQNGVEIRHIINKMEKPRIKAYFQFLKIYLEKVNNLNKYFQKDGSQLPYIDSKITEFYSLAINVLLKPEFKSLELKEKLSLPKKKSEINDAYIEESYLKSIPELIQYFKDIYGGALGLSLFENDEEVKTFVQDAQRFLMRLLYKAQKILPFENEVLSRIKCIFPSNYNEEDLLYLGKKFTNIIPSDNYFLLYEEAQIWSGNLKDLQTTFEKHKGDITSFYCEEKIRTNYKYITLLATTLLIFPHSNTAVERLFSQLKLIKEEKRTNLNDQTLESLLLVKSNPIDFDDEENRRKIIMKSTEIKKHAKQAELSEQLKRNYRSLKRGDDENITKLEEEEAKEKEKKVKKNDVLNAQKIMENGGVQENELTKAEAPIETMEMTGIIIYFNSSLIS